MSNAFFATVFYVDHDGADHTIGAVVIARDEMDAIESAVEAVAALPHCAKIEGGIIEPLDQKRTPNARADNAVPLRPANATVH